MYVRSACKYFLERLKANVKSSEVILCEKILHYMCTYSTVMNKLGDCFFVMQVLQDFPNATANVSFEYLFDLMSQTSWMKISDSYWLTFADLYNQKRNYS